MAVLPLAVTCSNRRDGNNGARHGQGGADRKQANRSSS
jgi:hypothetical protein